MREPTDAELRLRGEVPSVIVVAAKGCGKTTAARAIIRRTVAYTDWLIVDPEAEHWPRMYAGRATVMQRPSEMSSLRRPGPGWAYIFRADGIGEECAKLALSMEHCAYLDDEADRTVGKDRFVRRESAQYRLANRNRQHFVACYWLFRRMADVWLTLPNNATHAIIGYTQGRDDLRRVGEEFGDEGRELVTALPDPASDRRGVTMVMVDLRGKRHAKTVLFRH